ncbi:MAG: hypothetical protein K8R49_08630 [Candidatus Cloacimonetes bacterium]|nr:hypothetical protein [Candidatus Cloacimonadota bacterium]
MKKILLIVLLLIVFTSMLLADDIDREKYMPKKLIYSELPDNYPKELDELFEFYYEFYIHTAGKDSSYLETTSREYVETIYHKRTKSFIDSLSSNKKRKIFYLNWLANNSITDYYTEYMRINGRTSPWYDEDSMKRASYINPAIITDLKKEYPEELNSIILGGSYTILHRIDRFVRENSKDDNWFVTRTPKFMIRGKINELSKYENKRNDKIPIIYTLNVSVIDAIGGIFDKDEIKLILVIWGYGNQFRDDKTIQKYLKVGNEYIFSIIDTYQYYDFPIIEYKAEKYDILHDNILSVLSFIPLEDEKLIEPRFGIKKYWQPNDCSYDMFKSKHENDRKAFLQTIEVE